jgi:5'-nucleotidase
MRRRLAFLSVAILSACASTAPRPPAIAPVAARPLRILALNDFHGQLEAGKRVGDRPAGGAAVLAAWMRAASAGAEDRTLFVSAGDLVGGSPATSALLQDEPSVSFMNGFANEHCLPLPAGDAIGVTGLAGDRACNVVATIGNHELDEGYSELVRLWRGGVHRRGPFLEDPWRGARFPLVAANVVDTRTRKPVLPPFVVRERGGIKVGVIGAVTRQVSELVEPSGVAALAFLDEAESVNEAARTLTAEGIRAIVVLLHDGGQATPYDGVTRATAAAPAEMAAFVRRLDGEVDVVVSAHAHGFTNAVTPNAAGRPVLVTQAFSAGVAFARIDLEADAESGDVVARRAEIVTAWADEGPGLAPDLDAAHLAATASESVRLRTARVVASAGAPIARCARPPGPADTHESALGDLVADALRAATGADVALVNEGGLRADVGAGPVTWGHLYAVLPFGNPVVTLELTGAELVAVLEAQWKGQPEPRALAVSGLSYAWDPTRPAGVRVVRASVGGVRVDAAARYAVAVPSFLANGGDGFGLLVNAPRLTARPAPLDLDALESWVRSLPEPVAQVVDGRIARLER